MREATLAGRLRLRLLLCGMACAGAAAGCDSETSSTVVAPSQTRCVVQAQTDANSFPANGGGGAIRITVNRECAWTVQSEAPWLALQADPRGQGPGSIRFTVAANTDPSSRTARLTVNDQGVQISQVGQPCAFRLSSTRETVIASGELRTVHVDSSSAQCQWSATTDAPWITIVGERTRSGSGDLRFEVAAVATPPRTGTLTIAGQRVEVEQGAGCAVTTGITSLSVGSEGGTFEVPVSAPTACAWTAESRVAWITIPRGASGTGPGSAMVHVDPTSGPVRTGAVVVAGRTVTVTQSSGCGATVQPASHAAPAGGATGSVTVAASAGCAWNATASDPWIAITAGAAGSGAGQVHFTIATNTGPARSGSLVVGGRTVAISQASGCVFSVTPGSVTLGPAAQTGSVSLSTAAACRWSASSQVPWITPPPASGSGTAQVSFAVAANNGPPRSGVLVVEGNPVTVTQTSPCSWNVSPPFHEMGAEGGGGNVLVIVDGPCVWTASSATSWITMPEGTSGTGNGLVQFTVAASDGRARTGTVKIAGFDYVVTQRAR